MLRAVLDTNVIDAALRSRAGASYELLWQLSEGRWKLVLCNTLCTEYEEVLRREAATLGMTMNEIGTVLDDL
jgi:predicted nucleic acid-binding protein